MAASRKNRRTLKLMRFMVLVLITILVLRAVFLEPFTVPTGSMAPGIVGRHYRQECTSCGCTVRIGEPADDAPINALEIDCPNCGHALNLASSSMTKGDRLLVDKTAFEWRTPRRWEVIVFSGPDDPDQPYVKRVVGLPGETVSIRDGDVYVNGEIVRKSLDLTRAIGHPLLDMKQCPTDSWAARWKIEPVSGSRVSGGELVATQPAPVTFTLLGLGGDPWRDREAYNGRPFDLGNDTIHDFRVSLELKTESAPDALTIRLGDGLDEARLRFAPTGATLAVKTETRNAPSRSLHPNAWHRIEFALVDRRATARLDGKDIGPAIDLPATAADRESVLHPLSIESSGTAFSIRNLRLDRDLHYLRIGRHGTSESRLGPDEYFVLGDNSGNSEDSRFWSKPGVPARNLLGKPILIHAPHRLRTFNMLGQSWDVQMIEGSRFGWVR